MLRFPAFFSSLSKNHIDFQPGFKLNCQFLIPNRCLLYQPSDQRFRVFRNRLGLLVQEPCQVFQPLHQFTILCCRRHDILPFLRERDDGITDCIDPVLLVIILTDSHQKHHSYGLAGAFRARKKGIRHPSPLIVSAGGLPESLKTALFQAFLS